MGSWDETCALTNRPIGVGQRAVMVVFEEGAQDLQMRLRSSFDGFFDKILDIHRGSYDDYGNLEEVEVDYRENIAIFFHENVWDEVVKYARSSDAFEFKYIHEMNDRQWLEKYNGEAAVADSNYFKTKGIPYKSLREPTEIMKDFFYVTSFSLCARRDIMSGLLFRGKQEYDNEPQKILHELTGIEQKNYDKLWEYDDEEEST